ncbi:MAG TPA: hypothetical protein ENH38_09710, partial [Nitrospirae bacterium]|nr:hypothetical protein [Nitrospirota bacterium]
GSEPAPAGGPSDYLLFDTNHTSQTDNFCFQCHTGSGSYQYGSNIVNRSYSYRAGGWTADTLNDILEAFSFSSPSTSHNLDNISTFITGKWNYTADSNPCNACHNPHAAQGDPLGAGNSAKSSGTRGWPVSRPSQHSTDNNSWGLWGDASGEKMSDYTGSYQAPYRFGSTSTYEPDGSTTQNGSNLADFNTLCTDCHNSTNTIYSTTLARNLKTIDWDNEKHGKGNADVSLCGDDPYPSGTSGLGKVLACTDCHEPHGSPNAFLIREEVNGGLLGATIDSFGSANWQYLCNRCHQDDLEINSGCQDDHYYITHHSNEGCNSDRPYTPNSCRRCHGGGGGGGGNCTSSRAKKICTDCHYHGSSITDANYNPTTRRTF